MDFDNRAGSRFVMQQIDVLGNNRFDIPQPLQAGAFVMHYAWLFGFQIINKILGMGIIVRGLFSKEVNIKNPLGVIIVIDAVLAAKITDAGKSRYPGAREKNAIGTGAYGLHTLVHGYSTTRMSYISTRGRVARNIPLRHVHFTF